MIITIQDKATHTTAAIDSLGAQLISLKDSAQKEYIWQRDPEIWPRCSPLLFPAVGNCRKGRTLFEGQWFEMEKHGFCKESDFSVEGQEEDSVTFRLSANAQTRCSYPYEFRLSLTYRLGNGVLCMDYQVENLDSREICYCIGSHPGFICPLSEGESFEDYQLEFEKEENTWTMPYDLQALQFDAERQGLSLEHTRILPLSYELFREDAIYFDKLQSRKVALVHKETRRGVEVSHPGFETVAFWTPYGKNAPLLCIEPWNGCAIRSDEDDEFIHRHHVQVLKPGEKKSYPMEIRIL
ncbi:MAG: aldose 1-epimerase family protein [Lachnospiraceae bacterium]|nr:aldose 1-epimerase family protein [Lachnospiraceae bacterium]